MSTSTTTSAAAQAAQSMPGISFDGRAYHYRQYTYDSLEDALNYAKLERMKPGFVEEPPTVLQWKQWNGPTPEERVLMALHLITYEGGRYCYGPYHYDQLADAISYAKRKPGLSDPGHAQADEVRGQ